MNTEHLYFDARFIRFDHHDGISRFSAGLFAALSRRTKVTAIINDSKQLIALPSGCDYIMANDPTSLRELFIAPKLNKIGATVVFSPMQTMGSWFRRYKLILTLHDLIYYRHPTPPPEFNWIIRAAWRAFHTSYWPQRMLLNRADAVATVSKTSMRLILENKLTKRPISVIYNAAGTATENIAPRKPRSRPSDAQRLVYMGSFMDYKNVEVLVDGMKFLPNYELHLLSRIKPERRKELESRIGDGYGKVFFHNGVSEADYHRHLDQAVALVTGSRDEGFGIPLVESMSRGVPVVVSKIEIFKEIGADIALFFNQESPQDFANQIKKLESNLTWVEKSNASRLHANQFNWDSSADDLLKAITEL